MGSKLCTIKKDNMKKISISLLFILSISFYLIGQDLVPVGNGISSAYGIYSGTVTYNNCIYCCDNGHIFKWDGSNWSNLGITCNYSIICMEVYNNELYVGGWFTSFNGISANRIIKYNGTTWQTVGNGVNVENGIIGGVEKMIVYQNKLIAIGGFIHAGTIQASHIASWDGNIWDSLGSGINKLASTPSMCVFNNELYVFSLIDSAGGIPVHNAAKWDGSNWSQVGTGISYWPVSSTVYDSSIYVGLNITTCYNHSLIVRWDGTNWSNDEQDLSHHGWHYVSALTSFNSVLYATGMFDTLNGVSVNNVVKLDSTWIPVDSGVMGSGQFFTVLDSELYMTGDFVVSGLDTVNNIVLFCSPPLCEYGVEEKLSNECLLRFYPNPSTDVITIENEKKQGLTLFIYNIIGEQMLNVRLDNYLNEIRISSLTSGIYIIKVIGKNFISQKKLIKE